MPMSGLPSPLKSATDTVCTQPGAPKFTWEAKELDVSRPPVETLRYTLTLSLWIEPETRSSLPSPSKSTAAIVSGLVPLGRSMRGAKELVPMTPGVV